MPLAMKLVASHLNYWEIGRIVERFSSASSEEKLLYDYIFEDAWKELNQRDSIDSQSLLLSLSKNSGPVHIKLLYRIKNALGESLSPARVDYSIKELKQLSLIEIQKSMASMHSLTATYFGETLGKRNEK